MYFNQPTFYQTTCVKPYLQNIVWRIGIIECNSHCMESRALHHFLLNKLSAINTPKWAISWNVYQAPATFKNTRVNAVIQDVVLHKHVYNISILMHLLKEVYTCNYVVILQQALTISIIMALSISFRLLDTDIHQCEEIQSTVVTE